MNSTTHFELLAESGFARAGRLKLGGHSVETPVFMPVGTYGAVKTLSPLELKTLGSQIILGNTFHLYLRPGLEVLRKFGGLKKFMGWDGPLLTDSGGFQVFSLGRLNSISSEGVRFQNPLNGDEIFLTPELSAEIQNVIGADIAMVFDECPALPCDDKRMEQVVRSNAEWAKRFLTIPPVEGQLRFGIVQGGLSQKLRLLSLDMTASLPFDGLALGGLSVGETFEERNEALKFLGPHLPKNQPRYLMGVGTPADILEAIACGIDMFDCVLPTRNARNAYLFTSEGPINLRNSEHRLSDRPADPNCKCECCQNHSRGYLRHLFQTKEILGCRLATIHNVHYYHALMRQVREALITNSFESLYRSLSPQFQEFYVNETFPEESVS